MYLLALVATVMLPLGFVTSLLGVNVDGIPGSSKNAVGVRSGNGRSGARCRARNLDPAALTVLTF